MDFEMKTRVCWEEEMVSSDRGRREVHYYVLNDCGRRDLAVVGRDKSARHMTYVVQVKFLQSLIRLSATASPSTAAAAAAAADSMPSDLKFRSRKQVVDWLSLLVSDSMPYGLSPMLGRYSDDEDASTANMPNSKVSSSGQIAYHSENFSWLGSSWDCKRRRNHYQSFYRNGIIISVNNFVYVLTEDNKRLIAYIEDLYEDVMASNMVTVRWFHKVDEVSIVLPPDTNDREIFFSLCLQDFSVECIDGLASVLGLEDFEKFQKEVHLNYSLWEPYLCRRLMEDGALKPFDITRVQGYWSQNLLRSMYPSYLKLRLKIKGHGSIIEGNKNCFVSHGNDERKSSPNDGLLCDIDNSRGLNVGNRYRRKAQIADSSSEGFMKTSIAPGDDVELFSQDSGIRGCWFCCVVLKRHRDRIKIQYRDVHDADGIGNLEEWVSTSRIAAPDKLAIRTLGRPIVRPSPSKRDKSSCSYELGKVVDAWWHDGWWEGIIIGNDSTKKIRVYFPEEQRVSAFHPSDLRPSHDWVENKWNPTNTRPDIAVLLLQELDGEKCSDCITSQASPSRIQPAVEPTKERRPQLVKDLSEKRKDDDTDLINKCHGDGLRWNNTRKRTRGRQFFGREQPSGAKKLRIRIGHKCDIPRSVLVPKSLKVVGGDQENCKISGEPLFGAPMSLCSNLVMTR